MRPLLSTLPVAALTACMIAISGCGGSDDCEIPEVTGVQSPGAILPSREDCPEFYEGNPNGGTAPPVPSEPLPVEPEPAPPPPAPGIEPGGTDYPSEPAPPYYPGY